MSMLDQQVINDFKDKEYAHGYMEEIINAYIATQIKTLREQQEWTQAELAEKSGMLQPRIPLIENVNNTSSLNLETLRKLARAFDLVLCVSFENFSRAMPLINRLTPESLQRTPREGDLFPEPLWLGNKASSDTPQRSRRNKRKMRVSITAASSSQSAMREWSTSTATSEEVNV